MAYLRMGSKGDEVKALQELLNKNGYNLQVTGNFGELTNAALKDFQKSHGLTVDGIYGPESQTALSKYTPPTFNHTNFEDTTEGKAQKGAMDAAANAVKNYGDFTYSKDGTFQDIVDRILNREEFSYDLDGDALYQQYKDKYIKQGRMAMEDTMGQAAAMTGGYGNSYAQTAGQQAYNAQLDNLNDIVPELYQMAYDRYNQQGQDLYNKYSMLSDDKSTEYGMWGDGYNRLVGERDYASDSYFNSATMYNSNRDTGNALTQQEIQNDWNERQVKIAEEELELKKNSSVSSNTDSSGDGGTTTIPVEAASDYADWDALDWESYFAQIRHSEGKSAAEEELNRMNKLGYIPQKMVAAASIGARGSLGH